MIDYKHNGEHWYRDCKPLWVRARKWVAWFGGWEEPNTGKFRRDHVTSWFKWLAAGDDRYERARGDALIAAMHDVAPGAFGPADSFGELAAQARKALADGEAKHARDGAALGRLRALLAEHGGSKGGARG